MNAVYPIEYVSRPDLLTLLLPEFCLLVAEVIERNALFGKSNVSLPVLGDAGDGHIIVMWAQILMKQERPYAN